MEQADLIEGLMSQTGGLEPSDATTYAELGDLRRALIASVLAGQPVADIGAPLDRAPADPELLRELTYLAASPEPQPVRAGTTIRIVRRSAPATVSAVAFPADWTAGLKPARTFGPFVDKAGRPWWFDVFTFSSPLEVQRAGAGVDFLILPEGVTGSGILNQYQIPPGTVWIASSQFTPSAPPNTFVGIRIKSGQLIVAGLGELANPRIIAPNATVTLSIVPDPSSQPGPASGPGTDAANAEATFPATATFVFGPSGVVSISAEPASITAYGATFHLRRNAVAPFYDNAVGQWPACSTRRLNCDAW